MLISVLAWGFCAVGGAFCVLVAYLAKGIDNKLSDLARQGASLEKLVVDEIHRLELRVTKLEDWRDGVIAGGHMGKI